MEIKGVSNGQSFSKEIGKPKVGQESDSPRKDKLEISEEAKLLQNNPVESKKLEIIRERIANKFYDSDEVLNIVADKILQDIKSPAK